MLKQGARNMDDATLDAILEEIGCRDRLDFVEVVEDACQQASESQADSDVEDENEEEEEVEVEVEIEVEKEE